MEIDSTHEMFTESFWDARYGSRSQLWSGRPNAHLIEHASPLRPGRALDVGCGEGADAIWLAEQGWEVTAIDISTVALDRAARHAADAGAEVAGRIRWHAVDVLSWHGPEASSYDLVSAHFMHLPRDARETLFASLAEAVDDDGTLLIVAHDRSDLENPGLRHVAFEPHRTPEGPAQHHRTPELFHSAAEVAESLPTAQWDIEVARAMPRATTNTDGQSVVAHDAVLRARRLASRQP